jgi:hypothetical protein
MKLEKENILKNIPLFTHNNIYKNNYIKKYEHRIVTRREVESFFKNKKYNNKFLCNLNF